MKNLQESLEELLSFSSLPFVVKNRISGGCNVCFDSIIPSAVINKLIAFCTLNNYSYYISSSVEHLITFSIYR